MPSPIYLHPFRDPNHYIGIGPKLTGVLPASVSLHWVAPTIGRIHFRYRSRMGNHSTTFAGYTANTDRIYVMGHCGAGTLELSTETFELNGDNTCTVNELADLFVDHGLPHGSHAHIRIHACFSATPSGPGQGDSFAEAFREEMRSHQRNYPNITVRGYDRAVGIYFGWRWAGISRADDYAVDFV